jgi:hypothetical protein
MSAMDYTASRFWERKHHMVTTAALVVLFWAAAGFLVLYAQRLVPSMSPGLSFAVRIATILAVAFAYINLTAREATIEHTLIVGFFWSVFTVLAEMTQTTLTGRSWFALLGSPANPTLRYGLLFLWIIAPTLFVHARAFEGQIHSEDRKLDPPKP